MTEQKNFYLKLDSLNYNTLQALMLLQDTHTNSLDTYVLTPHNSSYLFLHFTLFTSLTHFFTYHHIYLY